MNLCFLAMCYCRRVPRMWSRVPWRATTAQSCAMAKQVSCMSHATVGTCWKMCNDMCTFLPSCITISCKQSCCLSSSLQSLQEECNQACNSSGHGSSRATHKATATRLYQPQQQVATVVNSLHGPDNEHDISCCAEQVLARPTP